MSDTDALPPLQYALQSMGHDGGFDDGGDLGWFASLEHARAYTAEQICREAEARGLTRTRVVPFREYVRTTEPKREVVELTEDVCLKGLKFAIRDRRGMVFYPDWECNANIADLFKSIAEATHVIATDRMDCVTIVGIREIPGARVVTREEVR